MRRTAGAALSSRGLLCSRLRALASCSRLGAAISFALAAECSSGRPVSPSRPPGLRECCGRTRLLAVAGRATKPVLSRRAASSPDSAQLLTQAIPTSPPTSFQPMRRVTALAHGACCIRAAVPTTAPNGAPPYAQVLLLPRRLPGRYAKWVQRQQSLHAVARSLRNWASIGGRVHLAVRSQLAAWGCAELRRLRALALLWAGAV